jgi:hypothetical protein
LLIIRREGDKLTWNLAEQKQNKIKLKNTRHKTGKKRGHKIGEVTI